MSITDPSSAEPNVPGYEEDPNSPFTASGATSITCNLAGSYEEVIVFVVATDVAGTGSTIDLRMNGDANANYRVIDEGGTTTTGATEVSGIGQTFANVTSKQHFEVSQTGGGLAVKPGPVRGGSFVTAQASNISISAPLSQFTLLQGSANDWTVTVVGKP